MGTWVGWVGHDMATEVTFVPVILCARLMSSADSRLGRHGIDEIKGHPFFAGIDWVRVCTRSCLGGGWFAPGTPPSCARSYTAPSSPLFVCLPVALPHCGVRVVEVLAAVVCF